ncbi:Pycsar system effector family protein [Peribacillus simplex]|uniref:Pycsar system effector family protein n=1 Tax=Peribacillus simplex TaxID=1478 RepID=UPI000BA67E79|nr:hypothetical protein [Peribacillus simplex]PAL04094.1 hypothetical protein B8W99_27245 [Peribacillus simplex]
MDNKKREELLGSTLERIQFWIGNVDAKISFLLSLSGALLGFMFASDSIDGTIHSYIGLKELDWRMWVAIINGTVFVATVFFISKAIIHFLKALKGRIDSNVYRQQGLEVKSLIFWGTIAENKRYVDFKDSLDAETEETILNDLSSQVYINSKITKRKFEIYNNGIKALSISIILLVAFKLIGYIPI